MSEPDRQRPVTRRRLTNGDWLLFIMLALAVIAASGFLVAIAVPLIR
jgi:hypothetical protein